MEGESSWSPAAAAHNDSSISMNNTHNHSSDNDNPTSPPFYESRSSSSDNNNVNVNARGLPDTPNVSMLLQASPYNAAASSRDRHGMMMDHHDPHEANANGAGAADTPSQYFGRPSPPSAVRMTSSSRRERHYTQEAIPPSPYLQHSQQDHYNHHHNGTGVMGPPSNSVPTPLHVKSSLQGHAERGSRRERNVSNLTDNAAGGGGGGGVNVTVDKAPEGTEEIIGSANVSEGNHKLPRPVLLFSPSPDKEDNRSQRVGGGDVDLSKSKRGSAPPMSSPSDRGNGNREGTSGGTSAGPGGMHSIGPSPLKSKLSTPGPIRRSAGGGDPDRSGSSGGGDIYSSAYSDPYYGPPSHGSYALSSSHKSDYYDRPMASSPFAPTPLHSHPREYMGMQASRMAYEYDRTCSKTPRGAGTGGNHGSPYGPDGGWGRDSIDRKPLGNMNWSEPRERGGAYSGGGSSEFGTMEDYKDENGKGFMVSPAIAVSRRGGSKR